ncbi:hypothetical protein JB92DRAFT_2787962 [Gautieria morchelliformis]|nr:hypothetical protein JB92DRAFT_2787962 [Gautieria morchelliformis]
MTNLACQRRQMQSSLKPVKTQISTVNGPSLAAPTSHSSPQPPVESGNPHIEDNLPTQGRNWFTSSRTPATHGSNPSTLADLLSRNPPPLPSEPAFKPPIFLAIGPSNKGFMMLQRKGWQEGEGLGSARVERKSKNGVGFPRALETVSRERNAEQSKSSSRPFEADVKPLFTDVRHEIIDLTLSDSESEQDSPVVVDLTLSDSEPDNDGIEHSEETSPDATPHGTTLLTPIATTLKADRLGIGLKPSRCSRNSRAKAITHTSAALAAHTRSANQARLDRERHGRGSRGFSRARRKEERERIDLLAYMKS